MRQKRVDGNGCACELLEPTFNNSMHLESDMPYRRVTSHVNIEAQLSALIRDAAT